MEKIFVKDLAEKQAVESVYLVKNKNLPTDKNGKPYLAFQLADKTGVVDARAWDNVETLSLCFGADDFVKIKGNVNVFQNKKQLVVSQISRVQSKDVNVSDFLVTSKYDVDVMFKTLLAIVNGIENKHIKKLILDTLNDEEIQPKYLRCPAAKTIHHAWVGGLLEHTLSICRIMLFLGKHYENVNTDLLIFGAIFHDIGKVWELSVDNGFAYTDEGRFVGHLVMGVELIEKKASAIAGFPQELKLQCKHIVLSHHGKLEYGSPKTPVTLEAMLVSYIDELDSKVAAVQQFMDHEKSRNPQEEWSSYNQMLERYIYLKPTV